MSVVTVTVRPFGPLRGLVARLATVTCLAVFSASCDLLGPGPHHWSALAASESWTCGISSDDQRAYCWGVASGFTDAVTVLHPDSLLSTNERPARVGGTARLISIANRAGALCGVGTDRAAYCAGLNTVGQVGDSTGNFVARGGVTKVVGNHRWRVVRGSRDHSCGVTEAGEAYCWGFNASGKLGNDTIPDLAVFPFPVPVVGNHTFKDIELGLWFTCALATGGDAWCWGVHAGHYLGVGSALTADSSAVPVPVAGGHVFASLAVGYRHACGVTVSRDAYCWGDNLYGELGDGTSTLKGVPTRVKGGHRWSKLVAGSLFTCGLTTQLAVYCWGANHDGQVGLGAATQILSPRRVFLAGRYRDLTAGASTVCGIRWNGMAECWGRGSEGQLGNGKRSSSPFPVPVVR